MKLKALTSCAKDDMKITLLDETNEDGEVLRQYVLLEDRALFPLENLPIMTEQMLMTIMDIPSDRWGCWTTDRAVMSERQSLMMADLQRDDKMVQASWIGIAANGVPVHPVMTIGSNMELRGFVESELLKVLADSKDLTMAERIVDGKRVFVLINGMLNVGCLYPTKAHWSKQAAKELACVGDDAHHVYEKWEDEQAADG